MPDTARRITTHMGPCHVGPGHSEAPTILDYPTLGEAIERQQAYIARNLSHLAVGYLVAFYLDIDGETTRVGTLMLVAIDDAGSPPRFLPRTEWAYVHGFRGHRAVNEAPSGDGVSIIAPRGMADYA